jgi:hypothetical protein
MLDKFKSLLGLGGEEKEAETEEKEKDTQENDEGVEGKTYEDIFAELIAKAGEEAKAEEERYRERTRKIVEEPVPQPEAKEEAKPTIELDENATVSDLLNVVLKEVDRRIRDALSNIPQTGIVESIVRENPSLKSIQDDAIKIVDKLPAELRKRETIEMLMWALKGMRAEAEKRSVLTEVMESLVGERRREATFVPLPYSSAEIETLAQKLKIDPNSLKKRLVQEFAKGGVRNEED